MESLGLTYNAKTNRTYLFWAVTGSLFCVGLALWSPVSFAFAFGAVFVGLFFSSRTFRWIVFPTVLVLDPFILATFGIPSQFGGLAIRPVDWVTLLLVGAVFLRQILTGKSVWMRTGLELPVWVFLGATAVGLTEAFDPAAGIVNWGHMALFFIAFYAMVADWQGVPPKHIWRVCFFWVVLAALSAVWQFLASGGARSMGFSGLALTGFVVPALCLELAHFTHQIKPARWFIVLIFILAAVASQTRGLWLSVGALLVVWFFSGYFLKPFRKAVDRRIAFQLFKLILIVVLILLLFAPFLEQVERRAEQAIQQGGTVYLRLFLWGLAWQLFLEHPVIGVGMGQFDHVVERFPEMKNLEVFVVTHGLSPHNLFFTFLAETGLVGSMAFFWLLISIIRSAWKGVQRTRTMEEFNFGWGLLLVFSVIVISLPFLGYWGYHFSFFLALLVLHAQGLKGSP
jgi:O-antigen ligase